MIKELLLTLKRGEDITLTERVNQYGDNVPVEKLLFRNGKWLRWTVDCQNSIDYGFGTCRCVSHPPSSTQRISRKQALTYLREYIQERETEIAKQEAEIAWLNKVSELTADELAAAVSNCLLYSP